MCQIFYIMQHITRNVYINYYVGKLKLTYKKYLIDKIKTQEII